MTAAIQTIRTARLLGTAISPSHFAEINRLHTDPQVMKTLSADGRPLPEEKTTEHIRQSVEHWQQHGFGFWVFHRRSDGQFVGRGGLKTYQIDGKDTIGLTYAVLSDFWNQGFATEMARASLDVGFGRLGFTEAFHGRGYAYLKKGEMTKAQADFAQAKKLEFKGK